MTRPDPSPGHRRGRAGAGALAERLDAFELPSWRAPQRHRRRRRPGHDRGGGGRRSGRRSADRRARRRGRSAASTSWRSPTSSACATATSRCMATTAAAEGSGVARVLMAHAERWTAERGLPLLTLNVFAGNARARRFYERGGLRGGDGEVREAVDSQRPTSNCQGRTLRQNRVEGAGRRSVRSSPIARTTSFGSWQSELGS